MEISLIVRFQEQSFEIIVKEKPITIGRSSSCDYQIADDLLSSKHCSLTIKNGKLILEDLNSKNGVFLNGIKISEQSFLLNDKATIGSCEIMLNRMKLSEQILQVVGEDQQSQHRDLTLELVRPTEIQEVKKVIKPIQVKIEKTKKIKEEKSYRGIIFLLSLIALFLVYLIIQELLS